MLSETHLPSGIHLPSQTRLRFLPRLFIACKPRLQRLAAILLACAAAFLAGCATQQVTQVTLSGIVSADKAMAGPVAPQVVRLTRGGIEEQAVAGMVLQPGDAIRTGPDAALVVSYPGGARAYVYPDTEVNIGSLFLQIGRVFVRVRGAFQVRTTFVTAASESTEYWVDVQPGNLVKTVVVEGRVGVYANSRAWSTLLDPNQQAVGREAFPQVGPANPADIKREKDWVRNMDRRVPVKTTVSAAAVGLGVAAGAALWYMNREDSRDSPGAPRGASGPSEPQTQPQSPTRSGTSDGPARAPEPWRGQVN